MPSSEQLWSHLTESVVAAGLKVSAEWFVQNETRLWPKQFPQDRQIAVLAAIAAVDFVLPEWRANRPKDTAPVRAVEAARALPEITSGNLQKHAQVLAKACTTSRQRSLGCEHRIAEAARAVALASASPSASGAFEAVGEALAKVEEHILYRFACKAQYGKEHEVRAEILSQVLPVLTTGGGA